MVDRTGSLHRHLERWSLVNALGMLGAAAVAGGVGSVWPLLGMGYVLLGGLVVLARGRWTPEGTFGPANVLTALRVGGLAGLPLVAGHPAWAVGVCLVLLGTDGVDGWLARRHGRSSRFGAFFDKETDALFVLVLCAVVVMADRVPVWVMGAGLLRYTFVVTVFWLDPPEKTEGRSRVARYIYAATIGALLFSFLPYPSLARPLAGGATVALTLSFGRSLWHMMPDRELVGHE